MEYAEVIFKALALLLSPFTLRWLTRYGKRIELQQLLSIHAGLRDAGLARETERVGEEITEKMTRAFPTRKLSWGRVIFEALNLATVCLASWFIIYNFWPFFDSSTLPMASFPQPLFLRVFMGLMWALAVFHYALALIAKLWLGDFKIKRYRIDDNQALDAAEGNDKPERSVRKEFIRLWRKGMEQARSMHE